MRLGMDIAERIPRRAIGRARRNQQSFQLIRWPVGLRRKIEGGAVARSNQKEALAKLRHAIVRGFQHLEARRVVYALPLVDLSDPSEQQLKALVLAAVGDPVDVLQ